MAVYRLFDLDSWGGWIILKPNLPGPEFCIVRDGCVYGGSVRRSDPLIQIHPRFFVERETGGDTGV